MAFARNVIHVSSKEIYENLYTPIDTVCHTYIRTELLIFSFIYLLFIHVSRPSISANRSPEYSPIRSLYLTSHSFSLSLFPSLNPSPTLSTRRSTILSPPLGSTLFPFPCSFHTLFLPNPLAFIAKLPLPPAFFDSYSADFALYSLRLYR